MGVRRQIYLDAADEVLLRTEHDRTGLPVSELVRRAIHRCYGGGLTLSWDEVFSRRLKPGAAADCFVYDPLFDDERLDASAS